MVRDSKEEVGYATESKSTDRDEKDLDNKLPLWKSQLGRYALEYFAFDT